eukprot:SAG11_NODE_14649_length_604_cov_1.409901_1_plen_69_part_10
MVFSTGNKVHGVRSDTRVFFFFFFSTRVSLEMMYQYLYLYYESVAKPWGSPYKKNCASVKNKAELARSW